MEIAVFVFDNLTTLDAIGPLEVLARLPEAEVRIVGKTPGPVRAGAGSGRLGLVVDFALAEVPRPDIIVVPGGHGVDALLDDAPVLDWLRAAHETTTWTTSVCTGALVLGAAGLLDGLGATTHWLSLDRLADYGAIPEKARVVTEGKIITAAGVSAGIDMALHLARLVAGDEFAQMLQLQIEYDPEPPLDSGSVDKASPRVLERAKARITKAAANLEDPPAPQA